MSAQIVRARRFRTSSHPATLSIHSSSTERVVTHLSLFESWYLHREIMGRRHTLHFVLLLLLVSKARNGHSDT